jgi:hypothetical protein
MVIIKLRVTRTLLPVADPASYFDDFFRNTTWLFEVLHPSSRPDLTKRGLNCAHAWPGLYVAGLSFFDSHFMQSLAYGSASRRFIPTGLLQASQIPYC